MQQTKNKQKPEITLMTLLAYEATEDAQQLLQKYKKPKAKNFADLEVKLGELYVSADDKLKLEKEKELKAKISKLERESKEAKTINDEILLKTSNNNHEYKRLL